MRTVKRFSRFTFSSDEPGSFQCKLDRRSLRQCRSPFKATLKPGRHVFRLRAVNLEETVDASPVIFRWKIVTD